MASLLCSSHRSSFCPGRNCTVVARSAVKTEFMISYPERKKLEFSVLFSFGVWPGAYLVFSSFGFGAPLFIFAFIFSPTGRLEEYLNCMDKIQKAVEYFQDNSPDSPELNRVVGRRSASWQGRERDGWTDRQTDMCCLPSCCKRLVGLLPGEKGVWAQLKKKWFLASF